MSTALPVFIQYFGQNRTFVIAPKYSSHVGQHKIAVNLNDGRMIETYTFMIMILSPPPLIIPVLPTSTPSTTAPLTFIEEQELLIQGDPSLGPAEGEMIFYNYPTIFKADDDFSEDFSTSYLSEEYSSG